MTSYPTAADSLTGFGRLGDGETAIGLNVDVSNVVANYSISGTAYEGYKYAAIFQGGNVGIGTSEPGAALHIGGELKGSALRVDVGNGSTITENALMVSETSYVGIGTGSPDARLTVKGSGNEAVLNVENGSGDSLLYVTSGGLVGIGVTDPSVALEVNGVVSANVGSFNSISATTMNIGSNRFVIDSAGNIGIGTSEPNGSFEFVEVFSENDGETSYTSEKINLVIDKGQAVDSGITFELAKDITGVEIVFESSSALNKLGDAGSGIYATATGVSIDMRGLSIEDGSEVIGLYVDVSTEDDENGFESNRIAAIFNGGYVGIGTANPSVELEVVGDIKANGLILSGDLEANEVTASRLYVANTLEVSGTVEIDTLIADLVSANRITVIDELEVATASFTTINVEGVAVFNQVGIGVSNPSEALEVAGNVVISGTLEVSTLNTGLIESSGSLTINAGGEIVINAPVSVNSYVSVGEELRLVRGATVGSVSTHGQLYVDSDGDLYYRNPDATDINISSAFMGMGKAVGKTFNSVRNLSKASDLKSTI